MPSLGSIWISAHDRLGFLALTAPSSPNTHEVHLVGAPWDRLPNRTPLEYTGNCARYLCFRGSTDLLLAPRTGVCRTLCKSLTKITFSHWTGGEVRGRVAFWIRLRLVQKTGRCQDITVAAPWRCDHLHQRTFDVSSHMLGQSEATGLSWLGRGR